MTRDVRQDHADSWDEEDIDTRGATMVDALLGTWPVPDGHEGHVQQAVAVGAYTTIAQLVAAGILAPGTELLPRTDDDATRAVVTEKGLLEVNGHLYDSPSGAVRGFVGHAVNGWYFWRLPDGRRLKDLRDDYLRSSAG